MYTRRPVCRRNVVLGSRRDLMLWVLIATAKSWYDYMRTGNTGPAVDPHQEVEDSTPSEGGQGHDRETLHQDQVSSSKKPAYLLRVPVSSMISQRVQFHPWSHRMRQTQRHVTKRERDLWMMPDQRGDIRRDRSRSSGKAAGLAKLE